MHVYKAKKEYMSYAKVMEKMGSAKSLALRGKGKARDSLKSVVELINLDLGSTKLSSIYRMQKRKQSKHVSGCFLTRCPFTDLKAAATIG